MNDDLVKLLLAVAAVAVIAFVGYFFIQEKHKSDRAADNAVMQQHEDFMRAAREYDKP